MEIKDAKRESINILYFVFFLQFDLFFFFYLSNIVFLVFFSILMNVSKHFE